MLRPTRLLACVLVACAALLCSCGSGGEDGSTGGGSGGGDPRSAFPELTVVNSATTFGGYAHGRNIVSIDIWDAYSGDFLESVSITIVPGDMKTITLPDPYTQYDIEAWYEGGTRPRSWEPTPRIGPDEYAKTITAYW